MMQMPNIADPNTYKLLTPGPLTTTLAVREAMLVDRCTWDDDYKAMTESIRASLLELAEANPAEYGVVLMQAQALSAWNLSLKRAGCSRPRTGACQRRLFRAHVPDSDLSPHSV